MEMKHWSQMWDTNHIGFHKSEPHSDLVTHEKLFLQEKSRVFLPLCGKSLDLVYLADKGHEVCGCEFVEKAVKDFFAEQNLEYVLDDDPKSSIPVYKAVSKPITLYQGDFFSLSSSIIGKFDAIWDRASLVAINPFQRQDYAKVMLELMTPNSKYLLNSFIITGENYRGPPHSVPTEDINKMYGKSCDIKVLDTKQVDFKRPNVESFEVWNRLLTLKSNSL